MEAIRLLKLDTGDAKEDVKDVLSKVIHHPDGETVQDIEALIELRRDELIKHMTQNPDADEPSSIGYAEFTMMLNSIDVLQARRETLLQRAQTDENAKQRMSEIMDTLHCGKLDISEYDDTLVRKLVESVTVIAEELSVIIRNGIEIRIAWKLPCEAL